MKVEKILGINSSEKDSEFIFMCSLDQLAFGKHRLDFEDLKEVARQDTDKTIYYCWLDPLLNMTHLNARILEIIPELARESENACDRYLSILADSDNFSVLMQKAKESMEVLRTNKDYYGFTPNVYERLLNTVDIEDSCKRVRDVYDRMMSSGYSSYHFIYNSFFFKRAVASKIRNMLTDRNGKSKEVDMDVIREKVNIAVKYFDSDKNNATIEVGNYSILTSLVKMIEYEFMSKDTEGDLHSMVLRDTKKATFFDKNTGQEHKLDEFQVIDRDFLENGRNEELDFKDKFINKLYHESNITTARVELSKYIPSKEKDLKYYSIVSNLTSEVECQDLIDKLNSYTRKLYGSKDMNRVSLLSTAVYKDFGLVSGRLTDSEVRKKMAMLYNNMMIINTSNMPFIWDAAFSEFNRSVQSDSATLAKRFFSYLDIDSKPSDSEIGHVKDIVNHYSNSWYYGYKTHTGLRHRDWYLNTNYDNQLDELRGYSRSCIVSPDLKSKGTGRKDLFVDDFLKSSFDLAVPCSNKPSIETMIPIPMLGVDEPISMSEDGDRTTPMKKVYNGFHSYNTLYEFYRLTGQEFLENSNSAGKISNDALNVKGVHDSAEGRLRSESDTEIEDIYDYRLMETLTLPNYSQNLAKMCSLPDATNFKINKVIQDLNTANREKSSGIKISSLNARKLSIIQSVDMTSNSTFETVFNPWDILCVPMTRASAIIQGYTMIRMAPWRLYRIYCSANTNRYRDAKLLMENESHKITGTYYQHVFMRHNGDPGYDKPEVSFNRFMGKDIESSDLKNTPRNPDFFDLRMVDIFKSDDFLHVLEYVYVNTLPSVISLVDGTEIKSLEDEKYFIMDSNVRIGAKIVSIVLKNYFSKEVGSRRFVLLTDEELHDAEIKYSNIRKSLVKQFSVQMGLLLGKLVLYTYDLVELCNCLGEFVLGLYSGLSDEYLNKLSFKPNLTSLKELRKNGLFNQKESNTYYERDIEEEYFAKDELECIQSIVIKVLNKANKIDTSKLCESTSIKRVDEEDNLSRFYATYLGSCVIGRFYHVVREIAFDSYLLTKYHVGTKETLNSLVCRMAFYCSYRSNYVKKLSRIMREYFSQLQSSLTKDFLTKVSEELNLNEKRLISVGIESLNIESLEGNLKWLKTCKISSMDIITSLNKYCEIFDTLLKEVEVTLMPGIRKPVKNVPSVGTLDIEKAISADHIGVWGGNSIECLKDGVKKSGVYKSLRFNEISGLAETEDGIPFCVYGAREGSSSELVYYVLHKCGLYLKVDSLSNTVTPVDTAQAVYTLGNKNLLSTLEKKNINDSRKASAHSGVMFDGKEFGNIQINSLEIELINSKELLVDILTNSQEKISKQLPDSLKEALKEVIMLEDNESDRVISGFELAIQKQTTTEVGIYKSKSNDIKKEWEQVKNTVSVIAGGNVVGGQKLLGKCIIGASREEMQKLIEEVIIESISPDSPSYELDVQDAFRNRAAELAKNSGSSIRGTHSVSAGNLDVQVRVVPNLR